MRKLPLTGLLLLLLFLQACINDDSDSASSTYKSKQPIVYVDPDDKQFAVNAAEATYADIELGRLAIQKGSDKKVKNFGAMLIKQHNKISTRLQKTANQKKITLPVTTDSTAHKSLAMLSAYSGKDFDKAFLNFMINNHNTDIKFFDAASKHVVDKDLKKIASKNLLILNRHLYALNGIKAILKY